MDSIKIDKYCANCGSHNHSYSFCNQPLTSYGLICFRPRTNIVKPKLPSVEPTPTLPSVESTPTLPSMEPTPTLPSVESTSTLPSVEPTPTLPSVESTPTLPSQNTKCDYEIVMVQRKYTIGYIEFLRGKYQTNNLKYLKKIISLMIHEERNRILTISDFDILRDELKMNQKNKLYKYEYDESKKKFNYLNKNGLLHSLFTNINLWNEPEWGLPKGRRNNYELNLECAVREFTEETGILPNDLIIYKNVLPLEEVYTGINNMKYKHVYYLATIRDSSFIGNTLNTLPTQLYSRDVSYDELTRNTTDLKYLDNLTVDESNYEQFSEINQIKWFNLQESYHNIREYYVAKLNIIRKGFQIINNINNYFEY